MRWKIVLALLFAMVPLALRAEEDAVIGENDVWKLSTTPQVALTQIGGSRSVLGGIGIGSILDDQWRMGIASRVLVGDVTADHGRLSLSTWDYLDVGGEFGYIFSPADLVHLDAGLYVAGGRILRERGDDNRSDFWIIEPSVAACLNLHQTWELGLRVGWRHTEGFGVGLMDDSDLREPVFTLFVRATEF